MIIEPFPKNPVNGLADGLPLRFLFASNPQVMTKALGIIYRTIATHLTHKAGFAKPLVQTGAVTLIQRFGSALNLNIHFHMLFLDGVYIDPMHGNHARFRRVKAPTPPVKNSPN